MERHSLRRFYGRQILKGALFASTALVLPAVSPRIAFAQIAPNTTPQGGQIVGGAAAIAQAPGVTTVNQASQNAAINWQSFNVGSAAKVQFNQPNASAIALNRVTGGNLSQINGQINANGQIVLINQSGVVFGKGSQVNAESVVVSTSDIATSDFMAGRMNFSSPPKPGAQIINNGNITARDAGLVGLVAPQVLNNGLITATLGQVILAGGSAFTLDLYGDRLISLDVTQAVRNVDVGGQKLAALVTNSGVIIADGGKVTLTAQDADALVTQLINAGGTIRADTVGAQSGTISVQGVGGNISIAGNLLARGTEAGTKGGAVQALTTGTLNVASGADIDVSGAAGGGDAAIGTDLARAQQGPTDKTAPVAADVAISPGAKIHADATALGDAGTITLLSGQETAFAGGITAQGGPQGGNGGLVEISSRGVIGLGGTVLSTAINGKPGEILLDPQTLVVTIGGDSTGTFSNGAITFGGTGTTPKISFVDPAELNSLTGQVVLEAADLISIASAIDIVTAGTELTLFSGGAVEINAPITVFDGQLDVEAGTNIDVVAALNAQNIILDGGTGNTRIEAPITAGALELGGNGSVFETGAGQITTGDLSSNGIIGGDVFLTAANNSVTAIGLSINGNFEGFFESFGTFVLNDATQLAVETGLSARDVTITTPTLTVDGFIYAGALNIGGVVHGAQLLLAGPTILSVAADAITLNAGDALEAPGGTIEISPFSFAGIDVSGTNAADLDLSASFFADLDSTAVEIELGRASSYDAAFITLEDSLFLVNPELVLAATNKILDPGTLEVGAGDGTLEIDGGGLTQGPAGEIFTDVLQGDGRQITGDVLLNGPQNFIFTLATISLANAAELQVVDSTELTIDGLVQTAGDVDLTARGSDQGLPIAILEDAAGLIYASTLSGGISTGAVQLGNAGNLIGTLGAIGVSNAGALTINNGELLAIDGFVTTAGAVTLGAPGIDEIAGGDISAGALVSDMDVAGDVLLLQPNHVDRLGDFTAGGAFDFENAIPLSVVGPLVAQDVLIAAPDIGIGATIEAGSASDPGVLALAGDEITVTDRGALRAPNGTIALAPFTTGNGIDVNGTGGDLNLSASFLDQLDPTAAEILLGQAGSYQAANITLEGAAAVTDPLLVLTTPGEIFDSGQLSANTLEFDSAGFVQSGTAAIFASRLQGDGKAITGDVLLTEAGNRIGTLGSIATGNFSLSLTDGAALTLAGPVTAGNISFDDSAGIDVVGNIAALNRLSIQDDGLLTQTAGEIAAATATLNAVSGITLDGNTNIGGALVLNTQGEILHDAGQLVAGILTGNAGPLANFAALTNFATIGSFIMSDGLFVLDNAGPLTLIGPLVASAISLTIHGLLTLDGTQDGGLVIGGGPAGAGQRAPVAGNSVITVEPGQNGTPGGIVQFGTFFINAGPGLSATIGGANADPTLFLTSSGDIAFATGPQGLYAPSIDLLLSAGGAITGNVALRGLTILNAQNTQLFGSLAGVTGPDAARLGFVYPVPQITQLFNDCEIEAVVCSPPQTGAPDIDILFDEIFPRGIVLPTLDLEVKRKHKLHPDIQLPGIAKADF
jgi:filamentous hemagglutinin family protein